MDRSKVIIAQFTQRPRLETATCVATGLSEELRLVLIGAWDGRYVLEGTEDFGLLWTPVLQLTHQFGRTEFTLPATTPYRFFRARAAP